MENEYPGFKLRLAPDSKSESGFVDHMDIEILKSAPKIKAGEALFFLATSTVTIPFCEIEGEIEITDDDGVVPIEKRPEKEGFLEREHYIAARDTAGDIRVRYRIYPRVQPADYRSSPYFDLVSEEGGANGAGLTFLPQFGKEKMYQFSLEWDLSAMPKGSRGIWSTKEGGFTMPLAAQEICYSYYAVGVMKSIEKDNFAFYWFSEPSFPVYEAAEKIQSLFLYMADFFEDEKEPYKVFTRRNVNASKGGTALKRSYLFGYNYDEKLSVDELLNLFAHEMVHNWPKLNDEPYGTSNWYSEGTAEFYSVVLTQRAGLIGLKEALAALTAKTDDYYSNPRCGLSNPDAAKEFWSDRDTQRIPYGRGLIYLLDADARIREKSGGARSVDNIVIEIERQIRKNPKHGNELWIDLVTAELGADEWPIFNAYMSGTLQTPPPTILGGAYRTVPHSFEIKGKDGETQQGYRWETNSEFVGQSL